MTSEFDKQKPSTSFDVASRAGVSRSAVSRAFTPGASISADTREKVMQAAKDLGYRVNQLARGLSNQRSELVGLIVADMDNPFRSEQVDSLVRELVDHGYRPILFPADSPEDTERIVHELLEYSLSGVIVTSHAPPAEICLECARVGVPLVLVNRPEELSNVDCVMADHDRGGRLAADVLLQSGCRDLVFLEPERWSYSVDARMHGFVAQAEAAGARIENFLSGAQTYEGGRETAAAFVQRKRDQTGVFCPTDYMALGFLDALRVEHGLEIPQDLCVVGYDDIPQSAWLFSNLTTIKQPAGTLAKDAVSLLMSRIEEPDRAPENRMAAVNLVVRGTTR